MERLLLGTDSEAIAPVHALCTRRDRYLSSSSRSESRAFCLRLRRSANCIQNVLVRELERDGPHTTRLSRVENGPKANRNELPHGLPACTVSGCQQTIEFVELLTATAAAVVGRWEVDAAVRVDHRR